MGIVPSALMLGRAAILSLRALMHMHIHVFDLTPMDREHARIIASVAIFYVFLACVASVSICGDPAVNILLVGKIMSPPFYTVP